MSDSTQGRSKVTKWEKTSVLIAVVALLIAVPSMVLTMRELSRLSNQEERANAQEARLADQEERLNRTEVQQYARSVYLGEAPKYIYERYQKDDEIIWVVMNASPIQVEQVWVEGHSRSDTEVQLALRLWGVQRCTMYLVPEDFIPRTLHFQDPFGQWSRSFGEPLRQGGKAISEAEEYDKREDAGWENIEGC